MLTLAFKAKESHLQVQYFLFLIGASLQDAVNGGHTLKQLQAFKISFRLFYNNKIYIYTTLFHYMLNEAVEVPKLHKYTFQL